MQATVVVDNLGSEAICGEWGLCLYIEYEGKRFLLDTGASSLFAENAEKLALPLCQVDYAVLSHAHYDHANGMERFFQINQKASFYLRDACGENCYKEKWLFHKYIGIPRGVLKKYENRIVKVSGDYFLCENVALVPHKTEDLYEIGRQNRMVVKKNGRWKPDNFAHEQSLIFNLPNGLVIFNSCSHGGADRIIQEAKQVFADRPVLAVVGGFHLTHCSDAYVQDLARRLRDTGVLNVYTGHCTGERAFQILRKELGDSVHQLHVGMEMDF